MKNFVQPGNTLTLPAPAAILSGDVVIVGELHGIAAGNAAIGDDFDLVTVGVFDLPKVGTDVFAIGDQVYFDAANKLVTSDDDSGANVKIGVAVKAAIADTATVEVKLI